MGDAKGRKMSLNVMKKNKEDWRKYLPDGVGADIHKELNQVISQRQIQRIIAKGDPDKYGVIKLDLAKAKKHKRESERIKKDLIILNQK